MSGPNQHIGVPPSAPTDEPTGSSAAKGALDAADYTAFLAREYFEDYLPSGGTAIKFVVTASDVVAEEFSEQLAAAAAAGGLLHVTVDAVTTRIHLIDEVVFAIARQLDWLGMARRATRRAMAATGYWPPPNSGAEEPIGVAELAALHRVDPSELTRDLNRQLQAEVMRDYSMAHDFRIAMLRLCQAELSTGQVTDNERDAIVEWLHGELRQLSLLKSAGIFRRIGRHNARAVLFSVCRWVVASGSSGLVVELDARRLGFARRPLPEERNGFYYTKAALLDAYELLRQLVDNTDELSRCAVVVLAAAEFVTDEARGIGAYQALKLRVHDEVRDRHRQNPFASLVRLSETAANR